MLTVTVFIMMIYIFYTYTKHKKINKFNTQTTFCSHSYIKPCLICIINIIIINT